MLWNCYNNDLNNKCSYLIKFFLTSNEGFTVEESAVILNNLYKKFWSQILEVVEAFAQHNKGKLLVELCQQEDKYTINEDALEKLAKITTAPAHQDTNTEDLSGDEH